MISCPQWFLFRSTPSLTRLLCLSLSLAFMWIAPSQALIEMDQLSSPELSARYRQLIEEYRCPKCQNQNLAGSDSPISADLRREIRRMLEEGTSDEQISDYLVARYGDFVLYRPRLKEGTYLLWLGPGLILLVGLSVAGWVISRQRSKQAGPGSGQSSSAELNPVILSSVKPDPVKPGPEKNGPVKLSEAEQQQLDELLTASEAGDDVEDDRSPP